MKRTLTDWALIFERETKAIESSSFEYRIEVAGDDFPDRFLAQAAAVGPAIDKAIEFFGANQFTWPKLSDTETFFLLRRLTMVSKVLSCIAEDGSFAKYDYFAPPPDPSDVSAFLTWALIEVWNEISDRYLRASADEFFAVVADAPIEWIVVRGTRFKASPPNA